MTTRAAATKTDTLLKILALERKQGYENRAVSGGLDAFLALGRREGPQAKLLTQFVARLPRGGYAALNDVERAAWHQLDRAHAARSHERGAAVRAVTTSSTMNRTSPNRSRAPQLARAAARARRAARSPTSSRLP